MSARSPVVLLGFDACDVDLVRKMAGAGKLPTFQRLLRGWATARVKNPYGFFVSSVWTSFSTAGSAGRIGFHCWETISPEDYRRRPMTPGEIVDPPFWRALDEAGRKVAVLDVPHARMNEHVNGLEVSEYGCHDRHFGFHTSPRSLADEIVAKVGFHPVFTVDAYADRSFAPDDYVHRSGALRTAEEELALSKDMLDGLQRKCDLSTWLFRENSWDLFISIFGESHGIGHQTWHLHDPGHPRYDAAVARSVGDPIEEIYQALDDALAQHLAMVGDDRMVLVLLSHGMGPHYDGTHLLEEVLTRIDSVDRRGFRGNPILKALKANWDHCPDAARAMLSSPLLAALKQRIRRRPPAPYIDGDLGPNRRARQRFFLSPNNSVYGGVRINLVGREPAGLVRPGREFDGVCEQLKQDLLLLLNVDTGQPVVGSVERTDAHYKRAQIDPLPDLLIDWNHDAPVETVWSPKTGIIYAPYLHWRTGDHRPHGLLFAAGPTIRPQADLGEIEIGNLGPTICAILGVQLDNVEGHPVPALIGS